jgi:hypothetical protein
MPKHLAKVVAEFYAKVFLVSLLFGFSTSTAGTMPIVDQKQPDKSQMNDIAFGDYAKFSEQWRLVTVRFREDTREMRFTYANDLAYQALLSGAREFPDGSAFGKFGAVTEADPGFTSSAVPTGKHRYQLMVKNRKKYSETGGWGYALFDARGVTYKEDEKLQTQACHACHSIVKSSDFVFSRPMALAPSRAYNPGSESKPASSAQVQFAKRTTGIPEGLRLILKQNDHHQKFIHEVVGSLREHSFIGTLDEILPTLEEAAKRTKAPVALISKSGDFSVAIPVATPKSKCSDGKQEVRFYVNFRGRVVRESSICV